jgi:amidase
MTTIDRVYTTYTLSKNNSPVAFCDTEDIVKFKTYDCFTNKLLSDQAVFGIDNPKQSNPLTGPLFVNGALPGDTIAVDIIDIKVGKMGIAGSGKTMPCFFEKLGEYKIKRVPVENGYAKLNEIISIPIEPMIGTIGVAPADISVPSGMPGIYGGNMDCKKIKIGSTVYLPVFNPGALLSIGDLHALMGDGEVSECGLEIEGEVTTQIRLIKNTNRNSPAIYSDDFWITIASAKTVEDAINEATKRMFSILTKDLHTDAYEAGIMLSLCGNLSICATNDIFNIVRMEFPYKILEKLNFIVS